MGRLGDVGVGLGDVAVGFGDAAVDVLPWWGRPGDDGRLLLVFLGLVAVDRVAGVLHCAEDTVGVDV